jgi:hypothetical protein
MITDRELLIELLAIKLFEHTPLGSGEINRLSWTDADPEDRQTYRNMVRNAQAVEDLYGEDDEIVPHS